LVPSSWSGATGRIEMAEKSQTKANDCGTCGQSVRADLALAYSARKRGRFVYFHVACSPWALRELARLFGDPHERWWIEQHQKNGGLMNQDQTQAVLRSARDMRERAWVFPAPKETSSPKRQPSGRRPRAVASSAVERRAAAPRNSATPIAPSGRSSFGVTAAGRRFRVRWIRHKPFLYEVVYQGAAGHSRPIKDTIYVGALPEASASAGPNEVARLIETGVLIRSPRVFRTKARRHLDRTASPSRSRRRPQL
jgi:hypothetical protein